MREVAMTDVELIRQLAIAEQSGEANFVDNEGHHVKLVVPQVTWEHVTGDFGEREGY